MNNDAELLRLLGREDWEEGMRALPPGVRERLFVLASRERLLLEAKGHSIPEADRPRLMRLRAVCAAITQLASPG